VFSPLRLDTKVSDFRPISGHHYDCIFQEERQENQIEYVSTSQMMGQITDSPLSSPRSDQQSPREFLSLPTDFLFCPSSISDEINREAKKLSSMDLNSPSTESLNMFVLAEEPEEYQRKSYNRENRFYFCSLTINSWI
jgi:hypothetical protein